MRPEERGHRWVLGKDDVHTCKNLGCTMRLSKYGSSWQLAKRGVWRDRDVEQLPMCEGKEVAT